MNIKRIARDILILIVLVGSFFLLKQAFGTLFDGQSDAEVAVTESESAQNRKQADTFYSKRRYNSAAEYYRKMTDADPDNGHAWYRLAMCYENMRYRLRFDAYRKRLSARNRRNSQPDPDVIEAEARALRLGDEAIGPLENCLDFQRYRDEARVNLAEIHAVKGDKDKAMGYLRDALNAGAYIKEGLPQNLDLRLLQEEPGFFDLVRLDRQNRNRTNNFNTGLRARTRN